MDLFLPAVVALNGRIIPSLSSCILFGTLTDGARTVRSPVLVRVVTARVLFRDTSVVSAPGCSSLLHRTWGSQSRGVPRESLDALENLPKEALGQVAVSQLEHEVWGMPDEGLGSGPPLTRRWRLLGLTRLAAVTPYPTCPAQPHRRACGRLAGYVRPCATPRRITTNADGSRRSPSAGRRCPR